MRDCVLREKIWGRTPEPLRSGGEVALLPAKRLGERPEIEFTVDISFMLPTVGSRVAADEWAFSAGMLVFELLAAFSMQPPHLRDVIGGTWLPIPV
jgi:hypothetical protein